MSPDLRAIDVSSLRDYLRITGWQQDLGNARRTIWRSPDSDARILVPEVADTDWESVAHVAIETLSASEHRDQDEIALDLIWKAYDKFHVRRESTDSALPLTSAVEMHDALQALILSAAMSTTGDEPKRSYHGGRHAALVDSYLQRVQMIPSIPGSFVARALLPLDLSSQDARLPIVGPAAEQVRTITLRILEASNAAVGVARSMTQPNASLTRWDDSVQLGVSSNLCDALARLTGKQDDVSLRVTWTWAVPAHPVGPVVVPAGLAAVLEAGADYLEDNPEEQDVTIQGFIIDLHREPLSGPGEITIRGISEQLGTRTRALKIELSEPEYVQASEAHLSGSQVVARATVRRRPQGLDVVRVESFRVLPSD